MDESVNNDIDSIFDELLMLSTQLNAEEEIAQITEQSQIELKYDEMMPIFDEYYGGLAIDAALSSKAAKKRLKDPKGGLTAAGRAYFKRKEGANLKPGVRGPANTPEKMRRKGSFLTRFFTNPSGPMKDEKGRATRLALSAAAWGEPVPQNAEDAAKLAAKGRRLLERYNSAKKKSADPEILGKSAFGALPNSWILEDGPEMKGLGAVRLFDRFDESPLRDEVELRKYVIRAVAKMSPSFLAEEKMFIDKEGAMMRMNRASEFMSRKRMKKKKKKN